MVSGGFRAGLLSEFAPSLLCALVGVHCMYVTSGLLV